MNSTAISNISSDNLMELQDFDSEQKMPQILSDSADERPRRVSNPLLKGKFTPMREPKIIPTRTADDYAPVDDEASSLGITIPTIPVPEVVTRITRAQSFAPLRASNSLAHNIVYEIFFDNNMPMWRRTMESWSVLVESESDSILTAAAKKTIRDGTYSGCGSNEWMEVLRLHCQNLPYYLVYSVDVILRGIGQVYLCNHPITGLFICLGYYITSPTLLAFAIVGTIGSTVGGSLVVAPEWVEISNGLFGYDGTLVGASVHVFFSLSSSSIVELSLTNGGIWLVLLLSIVGGVFHGSAMSMNSMPALTLAFNMVLVFYIMIVAQGLTTTVTLKSMVGEADDGSSSVEIWEDISAAYAVDAVLRGVGQFCFVSDTIGSLMVVIGIWICSRKAAYMAIIGSGAGLITSRYVLAVPASLSGAIRQGLYSYNSMGAAVSVAGNVFYQFSLASISIAVFTSILVVLLQLFVEATFSSIAGTSFPSLTIPFVITTWLVMMSKTKRLVPFVAGDMDMAMFIDKDHSASKAESPERPEGYITQAEADLKVFSS
jgi:urea transporter